MSCFTTIATVVEAMERVVSCYTMIQQSQHGIASICNECLPTVPKCKFSSNVHLLCPHPSSPLVRPPSRNPKPIHLLFAALAIAILLVKALDSVQT